MSKNQTSSNNLRTLGPFEGVSASEAAKDPTVCLEYTENMWRDPDSPHGDSIVTFPGFRRVQASPLCPSSGGEIYGMWQMRNRFSGKYDTVIHVGTELQIYPCGDVTDSGTAGRITYDGVTAGKSSAVLSGDSLWVFDGKAPVKLTPTSGTTYSVLSAETSSGAPSAGLAYIPTVFDDTEGAKATQERNLLTDLFYDRRTLPTPTEPEGNAALIYEYSQASKSAKVTGIGTDDSFVFIPGTVAHDGETYTVTEVAAEAFRENGKIKVLVIDSDISVGNSAFEKCSALGTVVFCPPTGSKSLNIGAKAFYEAPIGTIYLPDIATDSSTGILTVGINAFGRGEGGGLADYLAAIYYPASAEVFTGITSYTRICPADYSGLHTGVGAKDSYKYYIFKAPDGCADAISADTESVFGDTEAHFGCVFRSNAEPSTVRYSALMLPYGIAAAGKSIDLLCRFTKERMTCSFGSSEYNSAVKKCTVAVRFDGRVFISGNAELPDTVFYSEPISAAAGGADCSLYFPVSNSFDDGSDDVPVAAMVPSPATLTVFKSGTGGIFVHSPKNGAYPCISGAAATGTAARGGAVFFAGYPTFVTARGVMRLSGSSNSYERRAESLSADRPDIAELLSSYADECSLCVFGDRLVLCGRGEIYITDPCTDSGKAVWYRLRDIGVYKNQSAAYVPVDYRVVIEKGDGGIITIDPDDLAASGGRTEYFAKVGDEYLPVWLARGDELRGCTPGSDRTAEVYSTDLYAAPDENGVYAALELKQSARVALMTLPYRRAELGDLVYSGNAGSEEARCFLMTECGEMCGGSFDACSFCASLGGTFYFGTRGGYLCAFNTDKKGCQVYRYDTSLASGSDTKYVKDGQGNVHELSAPPSVGGSGAYSGLYWDGEVFRGELCLNQAGKSAGGAVLYRYDTGAGKYYPLCEPEITVAGNELHPYYYSFDGRAIYSCALTGKDTCGAAVEKSTIGGSVVLAAPHFAGAAGHFSVRCRTDRQPFFTVAEIAGGGVSPVDFSGFSFASFGSPYSYDGSEADISEGSGETEYFVLAEKCRRFIWKQYMFSSFGTASPFGICMLCSRFGKRG